MDEQTLESYRPLSVLSVVAAVLSLFSLLSFVSTGFLILAVVAVVVSSTAFWRNSVRRDEFAGLALAKSAFALSVLSLSVAGSMAFIRYRTEQRDAIQVAHQYLDFILANRMAEAFAVRLPASEARGLSLEEKVTRFGREFNKEFRDDPVVFHFQARGADTTVSFHGLSAFEDYPRQRHVEAIYVLALEGKQYDVKIRLVGEVEGESLFPRRSWRPTESTVSEKSANP